MKNLYDAADEGYIDPRKITATLGVTRQEAAFIPGDPSTQTQELTGKIVLLLEIHPATECGSFKQIREFISSPDKTLRSKITR